MLGYRYWHTVEVYIIPGVIFHPNLKKEPLAGWNGLLY